MEEVWEIMSRRLYYITCVYGVEIIAFVLMSNHFHLLIRTPQSNLSDAMGNFMRETSREITKSANRINLLWGSRHFRCIIHSHHYSLHAYKYVYRNPVEAGLASRVEDYPFSTLNGLLGRRHLLVPVVEDTTLFSDFEGTIRWLNEKPTKENWESVRAALRKSKFKLRKDPDNKGDNLLEFDML